MKVSKTDTVLITGAEGFIGKHLYKSLEQKGYTNVVGVKGVSDGFDLGETANVGWVFDMVRPDIVVHLASRWGGLPSQMKYPAGFMYENLSMDLKVLEEFRQMGGKKFIMIVNSCAYPNQCPLPIKEEDLWGGYPSEIEAPYGVAKRAMCETVISYQKQFGINAVNLILSDVYGPSDSFDIRDSKLIPNILNKVRYVMENNIDSIDIEGNAKAGRDFLHIDDCVDGIVGAIENHNEAQPINIASGVETNIKGLIHTVCNIMGCTARVDWKEGPATGPARRVFNIERAKKHLKFEPKITLKDGLLDLVRWYIKGPSPKHYESYKYLPPSTLG